MRPSTRRGGLGRGLSALIPGAAEEAGDVAAVDPNNPKTWDKVQRNASCPCGSGRKFKHCHGALT